MDWISSLETILKAASDVLIAGVAIVAFSLLIYSLAFRIQDRVTYAFIFLLVCIVVIYGADSFVTVTTNQTILNTILKVHWFGIVFLPTAFFLFSDSLLTMTGKPSHGKRRITGYICIFLSVIFSMLLFTNNLVGDVVINVYPAPSLRRTPLTDLFTVFFFAVMSLSWYNFIRSVLRTLTRTSRRRMLYLVTGAVGPAIGSFPYLLYGSRFAINHTFIFWALSFLSSLFVLAGLVIMTYTVSFFGLPWPDRIVRSRLFRWVMRGPITASLTLGVMTLIARLGDLYHINVAAYLILSMVAVIVLFEFLITLFSPIWEKFLFYGNDRKELEMIRSLKDRLLTNNDMSQFLELILASLCDRLQVPGAFLYIPGGNGQSIVSVGKSIIDNENIEVEMASLVQGEKIAFGDTWQTNFLVPITYPGDDGNDELLGLIVVSGNPTLLQADEVCAAVNQLTERTALALHDRRIQKDLMMSLEMLTPKISVIQDLLATSRFDQNKLLVERSEVDQQTLEKWVKDALTHLWGGPNLLESPMLGFNVIQKKIDDKGDSPVNALRDVLRLAIERIKPEGERQFTNEWILYNILSLKFLDGWKVKDIARRLSLSEADLYRKQRVAITAVSNQIIEMERELAAPSKPSTS